MNNFPPIAFSLGGAGGGGGSVAWGAITGTLSNQLDLQNALNLKANLSLIPTGGTTGQVLTKNSNANYDYGWATGGGGGGVTNPLIGVTFTIQNTNPANNGTPYLLLNDTLMDNQEMIIRATDGVGGNIAVDIAFRPDQQLVKYNVTDTNTNTSVKMLQLAGNYADPSSGEIDVFAQMYFNKSDASGTFFGIVPDSGWASVGNGGAQVGTSLLGVAGGDFQVSGGNIITSGTLQTAAAVPYDFGAVTAASVALSTTHYVAVTINGTPVKLAIVT